MMKKKTIICLAILFIFIIVVVAFAVNQRNNISAVITSISNTEEQIAEKLDESKKQLEDELKDKYSTEITDLTADEEKKIMKGELTVEEAINDLNKKYEEKKSVQTNSSEVDKLIGDKVIELYSLKAYYLGQLGQMEATIKREYGALPKEKQNLVGIKDLASKHMGTALALLNQCDAQVADLLSELEQGLKKYKADTSIIKTIRDTYEQEKAMKKAYYLKILEG